MTLVPFLAIAQESQEKKIMVIADPHVFAKELYDPASKSFQDMMEGQRKMLDLSEEVWWQLIDTALAHKPDLVLIPGDLTKDGEKQSHAVVQSGLQQLTEAGIQWLVIPGNHDIGGKAYKYFGDEKEELTDVMEANEWPYGDRSFAVEPFEGLTVLGIDGSDNNAGTGSLSAQQLNSIIAEADKAREKGNMIIAMSHWQLMDHFDEQGTLESACQFKNVAAIRDSLMHHGVRLVLTGHFHVNGITTWRDTTGLTNDSIVEITTGSPITFPCPYRLLTISADRSQVTVETDYIRSAQTVGDDMYTYSEAWMRVHTANMIPQVTLRVWARAEAGLDKALASVGNLGMIATMLGFDLEEEFRKLLDKTDEEKIDLVQRNLGDAIINLYILHSIANENEQPVAEAYEEAFYTGMESLINEMASDGIWALDAGKMLKTYLINIAKEYMSGSLKSLTQDVTNYDDPLYENRTDDLRPVLVINEPMFIQGIDDLTTDAPKATKSLQEGQLRIERNNKTYTAIGQQIK